MWASDVVSGRAEVSLDVDASTDAVWAVWSDGWSYPLWVVGATHMRSVDDSWPAPGSRLHHSVGAWPAQFHDTTEVLARDPGHRLVLRARLWPAGAARIVLTVEPLGGRTSRVAIREVLSEPFGSLVPESLQAPAANVRNRETLARLAALARHGRGS